jgi:hypothetical protein
MDKDEAEDLAFETYREALMLEAWEDSHERFAENIRRSVERKGLDARSQLP